MILPTKHISQDRALLTIGTRLLSNLTRPQTVSALWDKSSSLSKTTGAKSLALRYDNYVLTLDLLFMLGAIELQDGLLNRRAR